MLVSIPAFMRSVANILIFQEVKSDVLTMFGIKIEASTNAEVIRSKSTLELTKADSETLLAFQRILKF